MHTMYGDYLNMWILHNIKTMQIYKFTYNPVLLLFVNHPDRVSGRFIANRCENENILNYILITGGGNVVFFCMTMYIFIHQTTQNLNYGPVIQSQGHQSMSVGTALFKL